ncbi:sensor histidine kinase [Taibaiella soli]|uniref:Histidine kinase n=1 Tax=Taibaiella soli TaxID=1649169 RepID=A0A2W2AM09_9BACT|nr:histidine kinase [Taibaiella soli]PZF74572.1 histidine kinase [Taibaiella soli]
MNTIATKHRRARHYVLLWTIVGIVFLLLQPLTWGVKLPEVFWTKQVYHLVILIALYYANTIYAAPALLFRKKIWLFILWAFVSVTFVTLLGQWINDHLHFYEAMSTALGRPPHKPGNFDGFMMITSLLIMGISTSIVAYERWQQVTALREELEKEKISAELAFLKAQINPHFFFNTLNNIYSLSYIDVNASRDALQKLSRMMRYVLYEAQHDTTLLSKEISFIDDYIELMRLRLSENTQVHYVKPQHFKDEAIAPMLLMPFIENAFKHGVSNIDKGTIDIILEENDDVFSMTVSNPLIAANPNKIEEDGGIGLQNTVRRLELTYPGRYTLETKRQDEQKYIVHLSIKLS